MNRDRILIEANELLSKIHDPKLRIFDASLLPGDYMKDSNTPTAEETYLQGHIPGAAFLSHQGFSDASSKYQLTVLPEPELSTSIGNLGIAQDSEVVIYATEMIGWATRIWWLLYYAGHNNVRVLNGGLPAWRQSGGDIESEIRKYEPVSFTCHLRPEMLADKEEVLAAIEDDAVCTVNTLPLGAYEQAYIPGSICHPCFDLLENEHPSLPANDEIASCLEQQPEAKRIITYCGGGIAATVNAVANLIAGNENVAIYDGSMSEWLGEGLPTATVEQTE